MLLFSTSVFKTVVPSSCDASLLITLKKKKQPLQAHSVLSTLVFQKILLPQGVSTECPEELERAHILKLQTKGSEETWPALEFYFKTISRLGHSFTTEAFFILYRAPCVW